jgi:hypothetical protein
MLQVTYRERQKAIHERLAHRRLFKGDTPVYHILHEGVLEGLSFRCITNPKIPSNLILSVHHSMIPQFFDL